MAVTGVLITGIYKIDRIDICHRFNLPVLRVVFIWDISKEKIVASVIIFSN